MSNRPPRGSLGVGSQGGGDSANILLEAVLHKVVPDDNGWRVGPFLNGGQNARWRGTSVKRAGVKGVQGAAARRSRLMTRASPPIGGGLCPIACTRPLVVGWRPVRLAGSTKGARSGPPGALCAPEPLHPSKPAGLDPRRVRKAHARMRRSIVPPPPEVLGLPLAACPELPRAGRSNPLLGRCCWPHFQGSMPG